MKIDSLTLPTFADNKPAAPEKKGAANFSDILKDSIQKVGELEKQANGEVEKLAKMETQDIHNTMIAIEKADLSFQLMMQVRNKIINAYEEIMRMQV
jgi:flagellar hook-basal body complex protein FliE